MKKIIGALLRPVAEGAVKGQSWSQLAERFKLSEQKVCQRMQSAADSPRNVEVAQHLIGIERWGQRRLVSLLGEAMVMDEYDGYRPQSKEMQTLGNDFEHTRQQTYALIERLQAAQIPLETTVPHNDLGDLSVRAWLGYLADHALRESGRMKRA